MSAIGFLPAEPLLVPVELDDSQRAVVELPDDASVAVLGAPGTGKTTTLVETVAERVLERDWSPSSVTVLTTSRASATRLRDRLAVRVGRPTDGPLARTVLSFAHELATLATPADEEPPRLLTGAEEDADLAALLAGHLESGLGPDWPDPLAPDVRRMRGFRSELRDLAARATELGFSPRALADLGRRAGHPEWVAAGEFLDEYLDVVAAARPAQLGAAELSRLATDLVERGDVDDRIRELRLVLVDDLQEATEGALGLLRALVRRGIAVIAFGDPDVAANTFRGGEPDALGRLGVVLGIPELRTLTLHVAHRPVPELRALTSSVTQRIGTAAAGTQRRAAPVRAAIADPERPPLARIEAPTPARAWAAIARVLREEHVRHDVPWSRLAVVLRSGALVPTVARALAAAEVPTRTGGAGLPLRDDAAVRALVGVVEVGIGRRPLTPESASELLLGPLGGLDAIGLRRLRVALRTEEVRGGGTRPGGELLVEALQAPGRFVTIDARVARVAERMAGTLAAIREAATSSTIEELLWIAWERSGLAKVWRERALGSGVGAAEANRDLDGIVALFAAAVRFSERRPDLPAEEFLAELLDTDVADDLIAPAAHAESVLVTTPAGLLGLEFDTVVIGGLQEGVWPNLRPRSTLLAAPELARAAAGAEGPLDARRAVLDDELRMFALAVSRARDRVVLAAVANDDETPSALLGLLPPGAPVLPDAGSPLTLRGLTGRLRRSLTARGTDPSMRAASASTLARLAELGIPGASPDDWHGLRPPSTTGPLFDGETVAISPSRLQRFEESPLDWFLETIAGSSPTTQMSVGTLLHAAMERAAAPNLDAVWAIVEERWPELVFESEWLGEQHRRAARVLATAIAEYLRDFGASGAALVGAEPRFELELDDVVVRGAMDRVERSADGGVTIVDLKTGNPIPKAQIAEHPQLAAYQLAYRSGALDEALAGHGEHRPAGAKLLFVKQGEAGRAYREAVQAALDDDALDAFRERIRAASAGMRAASFPGVLELSSYGLGNVAELRLHRAGAVSGD